MDDDLVERLLKRAEIRRLIREDGERDRIADILEEAAARINDLEEQIADLYDTGSIR